MKKKTSITMEIKHQRFIKKHSINLSELVKKVLDREMKRRAK